MFWETPLLNKIEATSLLNQFSSVNLLGFSVLKFIHTAGFAKSEKANSKIDVVQIGYKNYALSRISMYCLPDVCESAWNVIFFLYTIINLRHQKDKIMFTLSNPVSMFPSVL